LFNQFGFVKNKRGTSLTVDMFISYDPTEYLIKKHPVYKSVLRYKFLILDS